jgi:16S rRNA processing protein RimM
LPTDDWVTIARIASSRGNRGEVAAESLSSFPERFKGLDQVAVLVPGCARQTLRIESIWEHKGRLVFKFAGVDSIGDAEALAGGEIQVPAGERWQPDEGTYFQSDLVGCEVFDRAQGRVVGRVTAIEEYGGPTLLAVSVEGRPEAVLVPFARAICVEIDIAARRIVIDPPEGLLEGGAAEP